MGSADPGRPAAGGLLARVHPLESKVSSQARIIMELVDCLGADRGLVTQMPEPPAHDGSDRLTTHQT